MFGIETCHVVNGNVRVVCAEMFADKTNITLSGSTLADLEQVTNSELMSLHCRLQQANKLRLI